MIDSVYQKNKSYYLFLEECKYIIKEKKIYKFITDSIKTSSDDSDKENSDEENSIQKMFFRKDIRIFKVGARRFDFPKYNKNTRKFCFLGLGSLLLKYKKNMFYKKYRSLLSFGLERSISQNIRKTFQNVSFFTFF